MSALNTRFQLSRVIAFGMPAATHQDTHRKRLRPLCPLQQPLALRPHCPRPTCRPQGHRIPGAIPKIPTRAAPTLAHVPRRQTSGLQRIHQTQRLLDVPRQFDRVNLIRNNVRHILAVIVLPHVIVDSIQPIV